MLNLDKFDLFADAAKGDESAVQDQKPKYPVNRWQFEICVDVASRVSRSSPIAGRTFFLYFNKF